MKTIILPLAMFTFSISALACPISPTDVVIESTLKVSLKGTSYEGNLKAYEVLKKMIKEEVKACDLGIQLGEPASYSTYMALMTLHATKEMTADPTKALELSRAKFKAAVAAIKAGQATSGDWKYVQLYGVKHWKEDGKKSVRMSFEGQKPSATQAR